MISVKSERAKKLLESGKAYQSSKNSFMRKCPLDGFDLYIGVELDNGHVKNLSFFGQLQDYERVLIEALSILAQKRPLVSLDQISLRECEAFLRDKNSEIAIENLDSEVENKWKRLLQWLKLSQHTNPVLDYQFNRDKGPFSRLSLVDKVRELKAFLASKEVESLYKGYLRPELIDLDEMTAFVQAPYETEEEKSLFEELHSLGVMVFSEEDLNFIPEP